jgi:hypothetical protein
VDNDRTLKVARCCGSDQIRIEAVVEDDQVRPRRVHNPSERTASQYSQRRLGTYYGANHGPLDQRAKTVSGLKQTVDSARALIGPTKRAVAVVILKVASDRGVSVQHDTLDLEST